MVIIENFIKLKVDQLIKNALLSKNKLIHVKVSKDVINYIIDNNINLPDNIASITTA